MTQPRTRRTYDHRLRELVRRSGNPRLATDKGVPRSTARDWTRALAPRVVSIDVLDMDVAELRREVVALRDRNARLAALLRLVVDLMKVLGVTLRRRRLAEGAKKVLVLRAVERSRDVLSLRSALRLIGLSSSRFWLLPPRD